MKKEYEQPIVELTSFDLLDRVSSESGDIDNPWDTSEGIGIFPGFF